MTDIILANKVEKLTLAINRLTESINKILEILETKKEDKK